MLNRAISHDRAVAQLVNEMGAEAGLIFTWLIPHLDREGRVHGDPEVIKGLVFPRIAGIHPANIRQCLAKAAELGLVNWYEADGDLCLAFPGFEKNQVGLRKPREPESSFPEPSYGTPVQLSPEEIRQPAGNLPAEGKGREGKGKEGKVLPARSCETQLVLSPSVITIPLAGKGEHLVTEADVAEWVAAYPGIDVQQELRNLRQWNLAEPKRRKTKSGVVKHITSWLARAQNNARPGQAQQRLSPRAETLRRSIEIGMQTTRSSLHDEPLELEPK